MNQDKDPLSLYFEMLNGESERGKILLLTAKIDDLLKELLAAYFKPKRKPKPNQNKQDLLLATMRPLGSFSARIEMAYRIGLISETSANCFDLLREIRNDCAHKTKPFSFNEGDFKRFQELSYEINGMKKFMALVNKLEELDPIQFPHSKDLHFLTLTMGHLLALQTTLARVTVIGDSFPDMNKEKFGFAGMFSKS